MRLKSLDIQGFKSFADRTRLDFNDGITAVIGPNGSGKSNIADALRWVLGEQSTRTLRGGKMEDVIFGGTQERKAQGVASVTLNIDNTDRSMAGFDCDEVSVTRRLYRSGDSEYRLNGALVRLKDITELFMDTGLGRDGYSIIGQGRVAEIVSAKSKERREIFEEAAGISKFRYRKTEAERRLALAEDNLLRLRDILSELEGRVGPLKTQSDKAQKYLELAADKKTLEVSVWMHSLRQLRDKTSAIEDKLYLAQADFNEADAAVTECEEKYNLESERGRALMLEIERQREAISAQSEQAAGYESQCAVLKNDISHHERSIEETKAQMQQAGRSAESLQSELDAANAALSERGVALETAREERSQASERLSALTEQKRVCAQRLEALKSRRAGAYEAIESARLDSASAATLLGESSQRIADMEQANAARAKAVADAEKEVADCAALKSEIEENLVSLENSARGYLLKQSSRAQKVDALDIKIADYKQKTAERLQRARLLSDMDKNMEGFGQSIKFVMNQSRAGALRGVFGPVSSLISVADEHTVAIETALGGAMQNIVVDNEDTAKRAIAVLKNSKAGRATFLPLTSVKGSRLDLSGIENLFGFVGLACDLVSCDSKYSGVVTSLLGRVVIAEDIDTAVTIAKKHGYRFRIVTLDGQVVNSGGSMTGGYVTKSAGILGRQTEIEKLNREAEKLKGECALIEAQRESAARELASVNAELDAIAAQKKVCGEDMIRCEAEAAAASARLTEAGRQMKSAELEREALKRRIAEMQQKSAGSKELYDELSAKLNELAGEITAVSDEAALLAAQSDELLVRQNECASRFMLCERDIEVCNADIARITAQMNSAAQISGEHEQKIAALEQQIAAANAQIEELSAKVITSREEARAAQEKVMQTMHEREESERACALLRQKEKAQSERRENFSREVTRLDEQRNNSEAERKSIIAKLYDDYELTQSDAEDMAQPIEDIAAENRRLSELKNKIKALGSVNVDAIEEYKEVSARYNELSMQLSDVERSKAELTRMINELTSQMCSIFSEKFEAINRNFGSTFKELFEGGSASLSLSEPDDVLESGIEINVHPPGKLIKNLAALSGGEQSFVAIAIFFSILKVNPSPFCLMDEIEAALDDVNVNRFAQYLHTLTKKTQFITITHRRGTMEEADVLYGVTMQEEGVSKLLELQVTEIEKNLGIK